MPSGRGTSAVLTSSLPWGSAAALIGAGAALLAQGHDGLAVLLGLAASAFVWVALLAPMLSRLPVSAGDPATALGLHYQSPLLGTVIKLVLLLAGALLLAADLSIAAAGIDLLMGARGNGLVVAIVVSLIAAVMLATLLHGHLFIAGAAAFGLVAALVAAGMIGLVVRDGPGALVSYPAVGDIAVLEQGLLDKRLVDPAQFRAHTAPFLKTDALNFVALAGLLGLGFAAMAAGHGGSSAATTNIRRRSALLVLALIVLLPPLAVHGKRAMLAAFEGGIPVAAAPSWITAQASSGLAEVCGRVAPAGVSVQSLCGKGFGPQGLLRMQDVSIAREGLPFAALDAAGLPPAAKAGLVLAALAAGAVLTAGAVAAGVGRTGGHASGRTNGWSARGAMVAAIVAIAGAVSWSGVADFVTLMVLAATLAACAVLPPLMGAIVFARPNWTVAVAGVAVAAVIAIGLTLSPRFAPLTVFEMTGASANLPPTLKRRLTTLEAQVSAAPPGPQQAAAVQQIQRMAEDRVTWFGLKPIASGLLGLVAGLFIVLMAGAVVSAASRPKGY